MAPYAYKRLPLYGRCLLSPLLLPFYAIKIYLLPCILIYLRRVVEFIWKPTGQLLQALCCGMCCIYDFKDVVFPANEASLGSAELQSKGIEWVRPDRLIHVGEGQEKRPTLFGTGVSPTDIKQGSMGDCWLVSSFAAIAEHAGAIEKLFVTKEINPRGKYTVRIFCIRTNDWVHITIDDKIPSVGGSRPLFAACAGNKIWVCLLEKAIAKYAGGYAKLDGNYISTAFKLLTGDQVFSLKREGSDWLKVRREYKATIDATKDYLGKMEGHYTGEKFNYAQSFALLRTYDQRRAVMGASITKGTATVPLNGLIEGHAYTILQVVEINGEKLVQLRNPWGKDGEWHGDWSDDSNKWVSSPLIRTALRPTFANDGSFWMGYDDFMMRFTDIDLADRTWDMSDLQLDAKEGHHCFGMRCLGPLIGCVQGCVWYWLCCRGFGRLMFSHDSSTDTVESTKASCLETNSCCFCMARCCDDSRRVAAV